MQSLLVFRSAAAVPRVFPSISQGLRIRPGLNHRASPLASVVRVMHPPIALAAQPSRFVSIKANQVAPGQVLERDGRLWMVRSSQHVKPGKGGAYMQVELREINGSGSKQERLRSAESVERVHLDSPERYTYLYESDSQLVMMHTTSFEQIELSKDVLGDQLPFLEEGMTISVETYKGEPVLISLPRTVVLEVVECEPSIKNASATDTGKAATLSNGLALRVPNFINRGDKVVVNTQTSSYMERA